MSEGDFKDFDLWMFAMGLDAETLSGLSPLSELCGDVSPDGILPSDVREELQPEQRAETLRMIRVVIPCRAQGAQRGHFGGLRNSVGIATLTSLEEESQLLLQVLNLNMDLWLKKTGCRPRKTSTRQEAA